MERSFAKEIESLKLGEGEVFHGEGILAVTKALLQSGVSCVGGYQGAPVSHLIDVMVQAAPQMAELGVHVEPCTNEASAAAMLGASIMYPVRGAVTWKSIVGTNVAADALKGVGVKWLRTVHTYRVERMRRTLIEAFRSRFRGLKVIVAEGECQLERQRRVRPVRARTLAAGRWPLASGWYGHASGSMRTPAPATTPASGSPAARR